MILFNELVELEAIDANPVKDVAKQKHCHKLRRVLSREEREQVNTYLKQHHYRFWLFLHIFFHSGARLTEIIELQRKNINLEQQYFIVTLRKGRQAKEVVKPIKNVALPFWREAVHGSIDEDFIFSNRLCPGTSPVKSYQITKRWNRHIKKKLSIDADFYSLKHLNLDETSSLLNIEAAAAMASHASIGVTARHYAINEQNRHMEKLKGLGNTFA
jgi:integrase